MRALEKTGPSDLSSMTRSSSSRTRPLLAEYAANAPPNSPQKEYGYRGGELLVVAAVTGGWGAAPTLDAGTGG